MATGLWRWAQDQLAQQEASRLASLQNYSRASGTNQGNYDTKLLDIPGSQSTGMPVGTANSQVEGQTVPTIPQQEAMVGMKNINTELARLKDLLKILPSETEMAGTLPGVVMTYRQNSNSDSGLLDDEGKPMSNRTAVAQLDAKLQSLINVVARVKDQQRGSQTEKDAERAEASLLQIRADLMSLKSGDTRESANRRIDETISSLRRAMAAAPQKPAVQPRGQAGLRTHPGGQQSTNAQWKQDANGNWVRQ